MPNQRLSGFCGSAVLVLAVTFGLAGCVAEPAGGENAALAKESMVSLRDELLDVLGAQSPDVGEGTAPCTFEEKQGVDWTSHVEFDALYFGELERAAARLTDLGYTLTSDSNGNFYATGPHRETVVLKSNSLSVFTGCVTE